MAARRIRSGDGVYCVDWDGVHSMLRSWASAVQTWEAAEMKVEKHLFLPDIYSVEVDWGTVRREATRISDAEFRDYTSSASTAMKPILRDLADKMEEAADARRNMAKISREAQHKTMEGVEHSVHIGEIGVEVATEVRNLSAEVLMVGASALTGGAASIALVGTGGAALKGFGTYQDAGYTHAGHATAVFGAELVTTFVPVGKAKLLKGVKDQGVKLFLELCFVKVEAGLDGAKAAWVEGKHAQGAILDATNSFMTSQFGSIAEAALPEKYKKWVVPTQFVIKHASSHALNLLEKSSEKTETNGIMQQPPHAPSTKHTSLMDAAVFDKSHIEKIGIRRAP